LELAAHGAMSWSHGAAFPMRIRFEKHKEANMPISRGLRHYCLIALATVTVVSIGSVKATDLNPAAISIKLPKDITWVDNPGGSSVAILHGDPTKPGLYILLNKWHAHHMSHPHFHPNDRFITVISGTWWVGTGAKFDPDSTVPLPAGSFVTHFAKQIHYDGAKDEDAILEIVGEGPATSTPAEAK
jgi:hypothetical protein